MAAFWRKPKPVMTGVIEACDRKVTVTIEGIIDQTTCLAMALCYAAKIRWLTLSEEELVKEIFSNVFKITIDGWPNLPEVDMVASLSKTRTIYSVDLRCDPKGAGWFVTNTIPRILSNRADLVTNYFFLLNKICQVMPEEAWESFGYALRSFYSALFGKNSEQSSLGGLRNLNQAANQLIDLHAR